MRITQYLLVAVLAHSLLLSTASAAELTAAQKREIISDCTELIHDYAYYRDLRDPEQVANLFTQDGGMQARGEWSIGHEALKAHVLSDDMSTVSMHLISTIKIFPIDENNATGVTYFAVANEPKAEGGRPATMESFRAIGQYHDKMVRTEDGWKFAERISAASFLKP